jgi:hypothetical protein
MHIFHFKKQNIKKYNMNVINIKKAELNKIGYNNLQDWLDDDCKHIVIYM